MKKFSAFQLKMFMALLMVLDHIDKIPGFIPIKLSLIFHVITRCVGVWFAYMAVQGFIHTRNRIKYNVRLFLWAGVMLAGNTLLSYLFKSKEIILTNNIFLTLACGVLMLNVLFYEIKNSKQWSRNKKIAVMIIRIILAVIVVGFAIMFTEGGTITIIFMLVTYLFRDKLKFRNIVYLLFSGVLLWLSYIPYDTVKDTIEMMMYNSDWLFITVIPFINMYNGERGLNNKFSKYFFYVFYPAHLWIIITIAYFVK